MNPHTRECMDYLRKMGLEARVKSERKHIKLEVTIADKPVTIVIPASPSCRRSFQNFQSLVKRKVKEG